MSENTGREKYLLLIVEDPAVFTTWSPERFEQHAADHREFAAAIEAAGATQLASEPLDAEAVRFRPDAGGGPSLVTDGPFPEAKEIVLGFYLLEVPDAEVARDLASRCPTMGYVELRRTWTDDAKVSGIPDA